MQDASNTVDNSFRNISAHYNFSLTRSTDFSQRQDAVKDANIDSAEI